MRRSLSRLIGAVLILSLVAVPLISQVAMGATAQEISSRVEVNGWKYAVSSEGMINTSQFEKDGPYTIGYVTIFMGNSWSTQLKREIMEEAEDQGDRVEEIVHLDAQLKTANQISAVEDLVARGVDAIVIDPISPKALQGVLGMARDNGIPVIGISSPIPTDQVTAWVGRDDSEYGRVTGKWLVDELNKEGDIIALSGIAGNPVAEARWSGAKEEFDKHADVNVLTREFAQWGFAQAKSKMANLLASYPEVDAIWSGGGAMTQGAMEAFRDADKQMVPMVGEANNGFLLDWIEASDEGFRSIAFNNPTNHSAIGLRLALKALQGQPIPKTVNVTAPYIFTLDQARRYARPDLADGYWVGHDLSMESVEDLWSK